MRERQGTSFRDRGAKFGFAPTARQFPRPTLAALWGKLRRADAAGSNLGEDFGQWVFDDGYAQRPNLLKSFPTAGDETFTFGDVCRIEMSLVEWSFNDHWLEIVGNDVLS